MELFFHSFGEVVSRLQDNVMCEGRGCWDKVETWFLKWNCFFIVWVRRLVDFKTTWCLKARGVGTKLRPKPSTSVSIGDSWWEDMFLMALILKFVWSSWRIRCLVFLKFFVVCVWQEFFKWEYGVWPLGLWCPCQLLRAIFTVFVDECLEEGGETWRRNKNLVYP